jgi:Rnl2 family RNA ligase
MEFKKYPSIENSYQIKWIESFLFYNFDLYNEKFVVTEKLHGANIQLCFAPDGDMRVGSRTQWTSDQFYNVNKVIEKYEKYVDRWKAWAISNNKLVRVYGELFGSNIQKGVYYGSEKKIRIFDVSIDDEMLSWIELISFLEETNTKDMLVPVIDIIGFEDILKYNPYFITRINCGLIDADNICEGVVVRPISKEYVSPGNKRFIIKIKNDKFKEKQRKPKNFEKISDEILKLNELFKTYITDMRLQGVFSKYGMIESKKEIGKYISLLLQDAKEDFLKENPEAEDFSKKKMKKIMNIGNLGFKFINKYLEDEFI